MARWGSTRAGLAAACVAALAACEPLAPVAPVPTPPPRPADPEPPPPPQPSDASRELGAYYARVQSNLLSQGLLRTDGGARDAPFSRRDLVENFTRIALFEEYVTVGGRLVAQQTESRLHRWETPVRMRVEFGETVPVEKRDRDRAAISAYAQRLARASRHPVRVVESGENFNVLILNEDERRDAGARLREIIPGISRAAVETVERMPRSTFCLVFALDAADDGAITRAVAVIRAEHPDLLRLSCIHEELAQGMGLSNDSPQARPSVFNDDEEYALLTRQDDLLLRMLYDERMRVGMSADEARAVAEVIAAELLGGEA